MPPSALFDGSPALKQLGALLDRATYISTCELFQPPSAVSALAWFPPSSGEMDEPARCIVGALLERQVGSLEDSRWKQGVKDVMQTLLDDALLVYEGDERPVRRARVLVRRLELSDAGQLDVGSVREEVQSLLSRKVGRPSPFKNHYGKLTCFVLVLQNFALDAPLAKYGSEFLAALHLWLAVHAHRTRDPVLSSSVISHAEEACKALRSMVPVAAPRLSALGVGKIPRGRAQPVEPPKRTTRAVKAAPKAKAKTATTRARAPPVTPKKRRGE